MTDVMLHINPNKCQVCSPFYFILTTPSHIGYNISTTISIFGHLSITSINSPWSQKPLQLHRLSLALTIESMGTPGQVWAALTALLLCLSGILLFLIAFVHTGKVFSTCLLPQHTLWKGLCPYPPGTVWASAEMSFLLRLPPQEKPGPILSLEMTLSPLTPSPVY